MTNKKCTSCVAEKQTAATISMSEANWERHENRHEKEKKTLFLVAMIATVLFVLSNAAWLVYETEFAFRCNAGETVQYKNEVAINEAQSQ